MSSSHSLNNILADLKKKGEEAEIEIEKNYVATQNELVAEFARLKRKLVEDPEFAASVDPKRLNNSLPLPGKEPERAPAVNPVQPLPVPLEIPSQPSEEELNTMSRAELQSKCKILGLKANGTNEVLRGKIQEYFAKLPPRESGTYKVNSKPDEPSLPLVPSDKLPSSAEPNSHHFPPQHVPDGGEDQVAHKDKLSILGEDAFDVQELERIAAESRKRAEEAQRALETYLEKIKLERERQEKERRELEERERRERLERERREQEERERREREEKERREREERERKEREERERKEQEEKVRLRLLHEERLEKERQARVAKQLEEERVERERQAELLRQQQEAAKLKAEEDRLKEEARRRAELLAESQQKDSLNRVPPISDGPARQAAFDLANAAQEYRTQLKPVNSESTSKSATGSATKMSPSRPAPFASKPATQGFLPSMIKGSPAKSVFAGALPVTGLQSTPLQMSYPKQPGTGTVGQPTPVHVDNSSSQQPFATQNTPMNGVRQELKEYEMSPNGDDPEPDDDDKIPSWAKGEQFLNALREQFGGKGKDPYAVFPPTTASEFPLAEIFRKNPNQIRGRTSSAVWAQDHNQPDL